MKKSEAFKLAQIAVLANSSICSFDKLEVLRVLMASEDLAHFCEKREEKEGKSDAEAL